ncbi:MAG: DUF1559 domain-containing protein [Capsulimonadaceae bacterium]|nr:DUF1559 domain-containing protein [Capsulimonadaceae bacterium]
MKLRGFTLIELLVVIAIICILAAILFPVFATAREKARQTTCSSNLKQIGLGFAQYEQDFDERTPCGILSGTASGCSTLYGDGWAGQIVSYVKSVPVFTCPDDQTQTVYPWAGHPYYPISYAYNWYAVNQPMSSFQEPARSVYLSEIRGVNAEDLMYPNELISSQSPVDKGYNFFVMWGTGAACATNAPATIAYATGLYYDSNHNQGNNQDGAARHTAAANYLLADGHVKWLPGSHVMSGWTSSWTILPLANCTTIACYQIK